MGAAEFGLLFRRKAEQAIEPRWAPRKMLLPDSLIGHLAAVKIVRRAVALDDAAEIAGFND